MSTSSSETTKATTLTGLDRRDWDGTVHPKTPEKGGVLQTFGKQPKHSGGASWRKLNEAASKLPTEPREKIEGLLDGGKHLFDKKTVLITLGKKLQMHAEAILPKMAAEAAGAGWHELALHPEKRNWYSRRLYDRV